MTSDREQRWKRFELACYGRLPLWLQFLLLPWTIPVRFLIFFPVLTPALCLAGGAVLAYLKLRYLHDQVSWSQVGMMTFGPLWLPVVAFYLALTTAIVGTVPILLCVWVIVIVQRWSNGEPLRPFSLDRLGQNKRLFRKSCLLRDRDLGG